MTDTDFQKKAAPHFYDNEQLKLCWPMVSPNHNRYANTGYSKTAPILKNAALKKTNDLKSLMVSNPSKIETILKDLHSCA